MIYAGVGARKTPNHVLNVMKAIAHLGTKNEFWLRTGDADGADKAFREYATKKIVFGPRTFHGSDGKSQTYPESVWLAADLLLSQVMDSGHYQNVCKSNHVHRLHMRNSFQILGINHDKPAKLVICWTPYGDIVGGTATAIKIAKMYDIPVLNLGKPRNFERAKELTDKGEFPLAKLLLATATS